MRDGAVADGEALRGIAQRREGRGVGAGEEGLAILREERGEKRFAARDVEMRRDLVEEHERRFAGESCGEARLREDQADEQRLLLSGGACRSVGILWRMADFQIGSKVRPAD
jgi:hypothetical protein